MRDHPYRTPALVLITAVLFSAIGYLGGRTGTANKVMGLFRPAEPSKPKSDLPPGPPEKVKESSGYKDLNGLLDRRLEEQFQEARHWKRLSSTELRAEYLKSLTPWPGPAIDINPQRDPWFTRNGVEVSLVKLQTHPGVMLTCALFVPQVNGPTPALLVLHGANGNLQMVAEDRDYHHGFGMALAQKGFIVLAPLLIGSTFDTANTLHFKALSGGWDQSAIDLWQLVRAVDYLVSLPNVDANRLGVYGISIGGQHALRLGALEPSLSLIICSGAFSDQFAWRFKRHSTPAGPILTDVMRDVIKSDEATLFTPSMGFLMDDMNLVALIQPRFFGVEIGGKDPRYAATVSEYKKVDHLYRAMGHPERAKLIEFEGGHETSVESVMPFLNQWREKQ